jgi:RNA polymerase sigma-70 factor, ECF subfamily
MQPTIARPKLRALGVVDPDLPLINASRNGDVSAFEELVKRYDRKLYRIAQSITHSNEDAEEAVQSAFFKAYQNLNRFQGNANFSTWLIRIVMNESFMRLRKLRSNREQSLNNDAGIPAEQSDNRFLQHRLNLAHWAANPESLYNATELRQILEKSLRKLQPALRVVFILRDIEEHSASEISGMLNLTPTAVRSRLSRARLRLREELSHYFNNPA